MGYEDNINDGYGQQFDDSLKNSNNLSGQSTTFMTLFITEIIMVVSYAFTVIIAQLTQEPSIMMGGTLLVGMVAIFWIIALVSLKSYSDTFKVAAGFFLAMTAITFLTQMFTVTGLLAIIATVLLYAFCIIFVLKFTQGCREILRGKDAALSANWKLYRNVTILLAVLGQIILRVLILFALGEIAKVVWILILIALFGMCIWHIVLVKKTDSALRIL